MQRPVSTRFVSSGWRTPDLSLHFLEGVGAHRDLVSWDGQWRSRRPVGTCQALSAGDLLVVVEGSPQDRTLSIRNRNFEPLSACPWYSGMTHLFSVSSVDEVRFVSTIHEGIGAGSHERLECRRCHAPDDWHNIESDHLRVPAGDCILSCQMVDQEIYAVTAGGVLCSSGGRREQLPAFDTHGVVCFWRQTLFVVSTRQAYYYPLADSCVPLEFVPDSAPREIRGVDVLALPDSLLVTAFFRDWVGHCHCYDWQLPL